MMTRRNGFWPFWMITMVAAGCALDTAETEEGLLEEQIGEIAQAVQVGDVIWITRDMSGKLFPYQACKKLEGDVVGLTIDGCDVRGHTTECHYNPDEQACSCAVHIDQVDC